MGRRTRTVVPNGLDWAGSIIGENMSVISGKSGAVDGAGTVRDWSVSSSADIQAYIASNTSGGTGRLAGNKDWSGSYKAYGHTPANLPGASFTFTGSVDGTNGVTGTARVDSVDIECDIEGGGIISHTVNFSSNGALTLGSAAATDATVAIPPSAIGCDVQLGTVASSPSWTPVTDVRSWTLTLTADNQSYVSSDTAGETKRNEGNLDATVSYSVYEGDPSGLPAVNSIAAIRLYTSASAYWELLWVMFGEASDIQTDIEGGSLVGATLNASMNAVATVGETDTVGTIKTPAEATIWPAA